MNQRLGLQAFQDDYVPPHVQKSSFFQSLGQYSTIELPAEDFKVLYSFDDESVVDGLNRSSLVEYSQEFVKAGKHLFALEKRKEMIQKTNDAMAFINHTLPELYLAINQLVACIAFYKSETPGHIGGTVSSAIGVIWLDPDVMINFPIISIAEQIVHEFIHTSLFYAEMVHGTYTNPAKVDEAKVISSIRKTLRGYDKSFHAAYVSTGLVAFHSRAGVFDRAEELASPLLRTVDEVVGVNRETGILDPSGNAMLQAMIDFLVVTRLKQ